MRIFAKLLLSIILLTPSFAMHADGDETDIIIGEVGSGGGTIFHAPALVPIQALYYPSLSTIYVNFLYDLGTVSVEIENETTGAYSQSVINATQGVHPFLISGASGHWTITFTLSNGVVFYGEFTIN